jgi:DNA-binding CsgD family transcriptional regulator
MKSLTDRQNEITRQFAQGLEPKEIAHREGVTPAAICHTLNTATNRAGAKSWANLVYMFAKEEI